MTAILAVVGGVLVGIGVGLVLGRGREKGVRRHLTEHRLALRASVVPVLEEHADALEMPESERCGDVDDPLDLAVALSISIRRFKDAQHLPFSDTLELGRDTIKKVSEKANE